MKVYRDGKFDGEKKTVLALGSFDAYHIAHIKLMSKAVCYARKNDALSGVYQFLERPEFILNPNGDNKNLYTNEKKEQLADEIGADFLYFEKFDRDFMKLSPEEFVKMLIKKFNPVCVVVGFHYHFGYKGEGDAKLLKELGEKYGFETIVVPAVKKNGVLVSSTHIRELILEGNVFEASEFLGRAYSIKSKVCKDRGVGSSLGFPTANLEADEKIILPKNGVYASCVSVDGEIYPSVTNVGVRPTFNLTKRCIESYILDFDKNIYEKSIEVFFLDRLRDEIKFENYKQLQTQILSDINKSRACFEHYLEKNR